MPIRFRCAYCNQLMGITRRKAGTVVSCPTCQGQVVVPSPDPGLEPVPLPSPSPLEPQGQASNVFERQDFDPGLFNPNPVPAAAPPMAGPAFSPPRSAPSVPPPKNAHGDLESEPFALSEPAGGRPRGLVLTPAKVTWLVIGGGAVGLILFGLGILVGKALG